uniref:Uncharacterized protein n=1 Tax=Homalodisca liturata TaxID=320908 RepID=A0A1B6HRD8_9HEMI
MHIFHSSSQSSDLFLFCLVALHSCVIFKKHFLCTVELQPRHHHYCNQDDLFIISGRKNTANPWFSLWKMFWVCDYHLGKGVNVEEQLKLQCLLRSEQSAKYTSFMALEMVECIGNSVQNIEKSLFQYQLVVLVHER